MHEMALTESVVALVEEAARSEGFARAKAIVLEIGVLGHVEPEAMQFCFEAISRGTIAEGARLDIIRVAGQGWCLDCGKSVPLAERFGPCPACGRHHVQMTAGDELRVKELEVE